MQRHDADWELYNRFQQGDEAGLAALISLHRENLTSFIQGVLHSADEAEELMIEAFAQLAASGPRFQGRSTLKTYLYRIGYNLALKQLRQRRREPGMSGREIPEASLQAVSAETEFLRQAESRRLMEGMAGLPVDYRTALTLVYFEGMGQKEAAAVMGKTPVQLNHLVQRGREALKQALEKEGPA